jgi:hypothetical protein
MLAKDVKRTGGERAYRLDDSTRIEWLTPIKARIFNRCRTDNRRWRECPDIPAENVLERAVPVTGDARRQAQAAGYEKDYEWYAARMQKGQISSVNTPTARKDDSDMAKVAKEPKVVKPKAAKTGGAKRPKFEGIGKVAWLCYLGSKGFGWERAMKVLDAMGIPTKESAARLCVANGGAYATRIELELPVLSKFQKAALAAITDEIPEPEKPEKPAVKKVKAKVETKTAKPAAKPKKKKTVPVVKEKETPAEPEPAGIEPEDEEREAVDAD